MKTAEVIQIDGAQAIKLPEDFHFNESTLSIRRHGRGVILEPICPTSWPAGFFESIRIDDPGFARPDQGQTPPAPVLG